MGFKEQTFLNFNDIIFIVCFILLCIHFYVI